MGSTLWAQTTEQERIATINIAINYLQTATEGEIVCRTTLDRRNRTIAVLRSEVRHEDGRLLVTAIGSYSIFPPRSFSEPATGVSAAPERRTTRVALTIAGSDSGGGAGIQADLKAFARCGVHGTSAITAITAQNTVGVTAIHPSRRRSCSLRCARCSPTSASTRSRSGCSAPRAVTLAVARRSDELPAGTPVVVDPVMVAESGARLLDPDAQRALVEEILPRATVLTPNLPEARVLAGEMPEAAGEDEEEDSRGARPRGARARPARRRAHRRPSRARGGPVPRRRRRGRRSSIEGARHPDGAAHGSGCTHSSVLAAQLALGDSPLDGRAHRPRAGGRGRRRRPARPRRRAPARSTSSA